jgi:hypothetical protein
LSNSGRNNATIYLILIVNQINTLIVDKERQMKKETMKEEERRKFLTKSYRCKEQ